MTPPTHCACCGETTQLEILYESKRPNARKSYWTCCPVCGFESDLVVIA